jgi:hypothetical protein
MSTSFTSVVAAVVVEHAEVPAAEVQEDHLAVAAEVGAPVEAVEAAAVAVVVQEAHHIVQVHQAAAVLAVSVLSPASQAVDTTPVVHHDLTSPAAQVPEELRLTL